MKIERCIEKAESLRSLVPKMKSNFKTRVKIKFYQLQSNVITFGVVLLELIFGLKCHLRCKNRHRHFEPSSSTFVPISQNIVYNIMNIVYNIMFTFISAKGSSISCTSQTCISTPSSRAAAVRRQRLSATSR